MLRSQNQALISKVEKPENLGGSAFFKVGGMPRRGDHLRRGIRPLSALWCCLRFVRFIGIRIYSKDHVIFVTFYSFWYCFIDTKIVTVPLNCFLKFRIQAPIFCFNRLQRGFLSLWGFVPGALTLTTDGDVPLAFEKWTMSYTNFNQNSYPDRRNLGKIWTLSITKSENLFNPKKC